METDEAYRRGPYMVSVRDDWTLAHGVQHLRGHGLDGSMDGFPEMRVAGAWSIDPRGLTQDHVQQPGVLGVPGNASSYR